MHVLVDSGVEPAVAVEQHARADHDDAPVLGDADGAGGVDVVEGQRRDERELGRVVEDLEAYGVIREHAEVATERGASVRHGGEEVGREQGVADVGAHELDVAVGAELAQRGAQGPLLAARECEVMVGLLRDGAGGWELSRGQCAA